MLISFLGKISRNINALEQKLKKKSAVRRVTSQPSSGRRISETRHARDLNQGSKLFLFYGRYSEIISVLG